MPRNHCFSPVVFAAAVLIASWLAAVANGQTSTNLLDLPPDQRTRNYGSSCFHSALQDVAKWHGVHDTASWWRENRGGALNPSGAIRILEQCDLRYAYTTSGDASFLEWCSRNRHGAAIYYYSRHAITFRGYADGYAVLQDNRHPQKLIRVEKAKFIRRWKGYGGNALTLVYSPYPPRPRTEGEE